MLFDIFCSIVLKLYLYYDKIYFNEFFLEKGKVNMKKRDIVIIAVFLVVALVGLGAVKLFAPKGNITYADIYVDDQLYEAVPLNEDTTITIDQGNGKINYIVQHHLLF